MFEDLGFLSRRGIVFDLKSGDAFLLFFFAVLLTFFFYLTDSCLGLAQGLLALLDSVGYQDRTPALFK